VAQIRTATSSLLQKVDYVFNWPHIASINFLPYRKIKIWYRVNWKKYRWWKENTREAWTLWLLAAIDSRTTVRIWHVRDDGGEGASIAFLYGNQSTWDPGDEQLPIPVIVAPRLHTTGLLERRPFGEVLGTQGAGGEVAVPRLAWIQVGMFTRDGRQHTCREHQQQQGYKIHHGLFYTYTNFSSGNNNRFIIRKHCQTEE